MPFNSSPHWKDCCGHKKENYCGTILAPISSILQEVDIYTLEEFGQSFCVRYGNKPEEYLSPGGIEQIIAGAREDNVYNSVWAFLRIRGTVTYTLDKTKENDDDTDTD